MTKEMNGEKQLDTDLVVRTYRFSYLVSPTAITVSIPPTDRFKKRKKRESVERPKTVQVKIGYDQK